MADQYEHARSRSAESYESGPSSQASTVPGPAYDNYGKDRYDNEYSQVELVSDRLVCSMYLHECLDTVKTQAACSAIADLSKTMSCFNRLIANHLSWTRREEKRAL